MEVVVGCSVGRGVEGGLAPRHDHGGAGDGGEVPAGGIRLSWGQVAGRVRRGSQPCNPGENHTSRPNHSKAAAHTKIWMLIQIIGKSQNRLVRKSLYILTEMATGINMIYLICVANPVEKNVKGCISDPFTG